MTLVRDSVGRIAAITDQRGASQTFDGWNDRRTAIRHAAWRTILEQPTVAGEHLARVPRDMRDLEDLAQLQFGLEAASNAAGNRENAGRLSAALEFVNKAWASAFCAQAGGCVRGTSTHTVDLAETVAVPGHRGRQRLGLSGRSQR
jgi:hypothetical protein